MFGSWKVVLLFFICAWSGSAEELSCHYTCQTCSGQEYYSCLTCPSQRGSAQTFAPKGGMCYCTNSADESRSGLCEESKEFNYNSKVIIGLFIGVALGLSLFMAVATGCRHFLIKTIEDVQEISIIILVNLYFPQQFDIFLARLYHFNITSHTFQTLTLGTLFQLNPDGTLHSTDGQNLPGKYQLLHKSVNFFASQFTWLLLSMGLLALALLLKLIRNQLKKKVIQHKIDQQKKRRKFNSEESMMHHLSLGKQIGQSWRAGVEEEVPKKQENCGGGHDGSMEDWANRPRSKEEDEPGSMERCYLVCNRFHNMVWYNLFIIFFYLSLIELNVNIFSQIRNLTLSSPFAVFGAISSVIFLAGEALIIVLIWVKVCEETAKPEWMRDFSFTAPIQLIRINYKTVTKYFWISSCLKKILLSAAMALWYNEPTSAIIAICSIQSFYLFLSIYCAPYQRRYIRIHFYTIEIMKLIIFVSLLNFTQKYDLQAAMISLTIILYKALAVFFGFNCFFILATLLIERKWYIRALIKKCNGSPSGSLGYFSEGNLHIYQNQ